MPTSDNNLNAPGLTRRGLAMVYDGLLLLGLWFVASALLLGLSGGLLAEPARPMWLIYFHRISLVLVWGVFFTWFWTHGGQTLGMRAWHLQLISSNDAGPVSWKQSLLRLAMAGLSAGTFGLGFFWLWIDPQRRTWHDRASGTHPVRLLKIPKALPTSTDSAQHHQGYAEK